MGIWRDLCKETGQAKGRGLRIAGLLRKVTRGRSQWLCGT